MPLYIRDDLVDKLARRVSKALKVTKTDAVRLSLKHELERIDNAIPLVVRIKEIQDAVGINGRIGDFDAKAFSDSLNDE